MHLPCYILKLYCFLFHGPPKYANDLIESHGPQLRTHWSRIFFYFFGKVLHLIFNIILNLSWLGKSSIEEMGRRTRRTDFVKANNNNILVRIFSAHCLYKIRNSTKNKVFLQISCFIFCHLVVFDIYKSNKKRLFTLYADGMCTIWDSHYNYLSSINKFSWYSCLLSKWASF